MGRKREKTVIAMKKRRNSLQSYHQDEQINSDSRSSRGHRSCHSSAAFTLLVKGILDVDSIPYIGVKSLQPLSAFT